MIEDTGIASAGDDIDMIFEKGTTMAIIGRNDRLCKRPRAFYVCAKKIAGTLNVKIYA
jgi:hypothetical protein